MELLELERAFRRHAAVVVTGMGGMGKTALSREAAAWWLRTDAFTPPCFARLNFARAPSAPCNCWVRRWKATSSVRARRKTSGIPPSACSTNSVCWWCGIISSLRCRRFSRTSFPQARSLREGLLQLYCDLTMPPTGHLPAGRLLVTCRPAETGLPRIKEMLLCGLARPDSLYLLRAVLDLKGISTDLKGYERTEMDKLLDALSDHPLSIELVAPHLRQLTPAEILCDYDKTAGALCRRSRHEGRNKSLLASLEFSRRRLSQPAQDVLPYLAWFEGGVFEDKPARLY